jgi:poly-beta-1,6-N-acetyl-D-glucosamine synthase
MFFDWTHWLSSLHPEESLTIAVGLLLVDAPRYALAQLAMCLWDLVALTLGALRPRAAAPASEHWPSVCVILAGYNEGPTIESTITSLYGTYPNLQVVVVDDGSEDDMCRRARRLIRRYPGLLVFRRPRRGGKSSAMNSALPYTQAEIVIIVDADSALSPDALREIVQPFANPRVGIVAATILARNRTAGLIARLQACEYLQSIFMGRRVLERLQILGIASGAFTAIRRSVLLQVGGWDVGPPEDLDLTLRVRKAGYDVALAPNAVCYTDVPTTLRGLVRQRLRWDQGSVVRHLLRKHADLWNPRCRNFRWQNLLMAFDQLLFEFLCPYLFLLYSAWLCLHPVANAGFVAFTLYLLAVVFELVHAATVTFYALDLRRDLATSLVLPIMPAYRLMLMGVRVVAHTQELLWRRSFQDNHVPKHVRNATWHW